MDAKPGIVLVGWTMLDAVALRVRRRGCGLDAREC
jgi:hypothetical protein